MRIAAVAFAGAVALAASSLGASAAPAAPDLGMSAGSGNIVEAAFGCGRGFHPNRWGRCVPHGYGGYWSQSRSHYYGGGYPYYGGGYPYRHHYRSWYGY